MDRNDLAVRANRIVSATHNNQALNAAIRHGARRHLDAALRKLAVHLASPPGPV